ncbi:MAG: pentapeptide repeat-containing protein, partial [Hyphomicrobiaceae bacterium]
MRRYTRVARDEWGSAIGWSARSIVAGIAAVLVIGLRPVPAAAQDMLQFLDLKSAEFTTSELSRGDVEALLAARKPGSPLDLSAKRLNGLDLSGLDLSGANLQSARINRTNFKNAKLDGAVLDQAWALDADFTGATFKGASLFSTQFIGAKMDGADFTAARVAGDFSRASLKGSKFDRADLSADMRNQSMGLMRGVFRSADLDGASFRDA